MNERSKKPGRTAATPRKRRPYSPPRIEQVDIVPGEAMLGFCKVAGEMGGMGVCATMCSGSGS